MQIQNEIRNKFQPAAPFEAPNTAFLLEEAAETEVLEFLERRPVETAMLSGLIRDNGLKNRFNRGSFYGCRNPQGEFEGVALVGHATLFETSTNRALRSLARVAETCATTHMIMGEAGLLDRFCGFYSQPRLTPRKTCRERLLELRSPVQTRPEVPGLRPATMNDIDLILPIHAQMALAESGVDPMAKDPQSFRNRYARRIRKDRSWVWIESGKPIFKAEIVSKTPRVAYLEGIWTNPDNRSQGQGTDCLLQLSKRLLAHSESICVFVNEENAAALRFYERAGFKSKSTYDTIFLQPY
jgi:ribosomal protein S18 acetylase RimI-like enzyme